jgi:hypothetical protein
MGMQFQTQEKRVIGLTLLHPTHDQEPGGKEQLFIGHRGRQGISISF